MKKNYFILVFTFFFLVLCSAKGYATNVTGGIYSNTTWTAASNPYIVSDTLVIFENITLTIDPGVIVEFNDGAFIEQRGNLYANGKSGLSYRSSPAKISLIFLTYV